MEDGKKDGIDDLRWSTPVEHMDLGKDASRDGRRAGTWRAASRGTAGETLRGMAACPFSGSQSAP